MRTLLNHLFGRQSNGTQATRASASNGPAPAGMEPLESRRLMSVGLSGTALVIEGAGTVDQGYITPIQDNGRTRYRVVGNFAGRQEDRYYESSQVKQVVFRGWAGADNFANATALPCWIYGGEGDDRLTGGFGQDVIYGEGGNDQINDQTTRATANWDNWIFGGAGNDYIIGSAGNDQIHGESGADSIFGGDAIDYLWGEDGNDRLEGGWGNDVLYGGNGNDILAGQQGDDWLTGEAGADTLYGSSNRDAFHYDPADIRDFNASEGDKWWY